MRKSSKFILTSALALVFFIVGCADNSKGQASGNKIESDHYFVLKSLDGSEINLGKELSSHKAVLLNFWATWCPPCREEIPELIQLQEKYKDQAFTVIGVDIGESSERVSKFVKKMKINYPIALDEDSAVAERYGVVGIPTTLLIRPDGTVIREYHAYTRQLEADVEKILAQ